MKRAKFIYNPASGENSVVEYVDRIIAAYQRHGFLLSVFRLDFTRSAEEMLSDVDQTTDHLLIAGGDGTINFVINAMKRCGVDLPVGLLPSGTANDFAFCVGMPADTMTAVDMILSGTPHSIDLGRVNGVWYVNILSCGLFTDVSQKTPTLLKNAFGKLAYYVNGINELPKFRNMKLNIVADDFTYNGNVLILFVFNGRTAGGFPLAHLSSLSDGKLDVLVVQGRTPLLAARTVIRYLRNLPRHRYPKSILHFQTERLKVESERQETTDVDGQPAPSFPMEIECDKGAVKILY